MYARRLRVRGADTGLMGWVGYDDSNELYLIIEGIHNEDVYIVFRLHAVAPSSGALELETVLCPPSKRQLKVNVDCYLTDAVCNALNNRSEARSLVIAPGGTPCKAAVHFFHNQISPDMAITEKPTLFTTPRRWAWVV